MLWPLTRMPTAQILPPLPDEPAELTVDRFLQPVGATLAQGQPLVIVHSDSREWELPSSIAGTLSAIHVEPGTSVATGAVLAEIEPAAAAEPEQERAAPASVSAIRATPVARSIAAAHALSLATVAGSGPGGRIMRADVLSRIATATPTHTPTEREAATPIVKPVTPGRPSETALPAPRELATFQPVPHALTAIEIDLSAVYEHMRRQRPRLQRRGIAVDYVAYIAHAVALGALEERAINSAWSDDGIIQWARLDLGIARPPDGTTHVVVDAAAYSVAGLARVMEYEQAETVPAPTLRIAAGAGTRWGEIGGLPTYGALVHIGAPVSRPVVISDAAGDTVAIRPTCVITLAYDARIVDQPRADAFLSGLRRRLEHFPAV